MGSICHIVDCKKNSYVGMCTYLILFKFGMMKDIFDLNISVLVCVTLTLILFKLCVCDSYHYIRSLSFSVTLAFMHGDMNQPKFSDV